MENQDSLRFIVGRADACELLATTFSFPTRVLAGAVVDGAYGGDVASCLGDMGIGSKAREIEGLLRKICKDNVEDLFHRLRRDHTVLYLLPGGEAAVWPYEAAFRHGSLGHDGLPVLFRSPCQLDVERHMREAGVMPADARREPSDSVWNELSFLSYLYGSLAAALHEDRDDDAALWRARIAAFWNEHASRWLPDFMKQTQEAVARLSRGAEYGVFAALGQVALAAIAEDVAPVMPAS